MTDRPTDAERLALYGLPDPLEPTRLTITDWRTAAAEVTTAVTTYHGHSDDADLRYATSLFLGRVATAIYLAERDNGAEDIAVVDTGVGPDEKYGWEIRRHLSFTYVWWTDFVANDWIQIVRDVPHARLFLSALEAVVAAEESLPTRWEETIPPAASPDGQWSVDTQIMATVILNPDGTPERVEVPMTFDPDFIIAVRAPDGKTWDVDADGIPDYVADVWNAVKGGEVYAPHID